MANINAPLEGLIFDLAQREWMFHRELNHKADDIGRAVETAKGVLIGHSAWVGRLCLRLKPISSDKP